MGATGFQLRRRMLAAQAAEALAAAQAAEALAAAQAAEAQAKAQSDAAALLGEVAPEPKGAKKNA